MLEKLISHMEIKGTLYLASKPVTLQGFSQILRWKSSLVSFGNLSILVRFYCFELLI